MLARLSRGYASTSRLPTIFAPATPFVKSAVSILRISGPDALQVWHKMTASVRGGRDNTSTEPASRRALLRRILHPTTKEVLDEGLVLRFPAERSLTGQELLELHVHGSPPLVKTLMDAIATLGPSFRVAEPGEFTRLAFESGKMDLTQVEGLRDLIDATTEQQRRLASRQATGAVSKVYQAMQNALIEATALVEAVIDFGEDQGIDDSVFEQVLDKVTQVQGLIHTHLAKDKAAEVIRSGISLAIIGAPNAGKSSLFNHLAQREAAIVTPVAGTTRDVLELWLDIGGYPVKVLDTAGLRATEDQVEQIGVARAKQRALEADIRACILSAPEVFANGGVKIDSDTLDLIDASTLILINKSDLFSETGLEAASVSQRLHAFLAQAGKTIYGSPVIASIASSAGMDSLQAGLSSALNDLFSFDDKEWPIITQQRHRVALEECDQYLQSFQDMSRDDIVLAAEELRYASDAIARIVGAVDTETILGHIFAGFCIGK